jgi:CrcB protein
VTSVLEWVGVALLGGLGALARFRLDAAVQRRAAGEFPFGTLAVNLVGAFCLGLLTGLSVTGGALLLSGTAALGSFTTFSTWMLETERLAEEGEGRLAAASVAVTLGAGAVAAMLGWLLGAVL